MEPKKARNKLYSKQLNALSSQNKNARRKNHSLPTNGANFRNEKNLEINNYNR